MLNGMTSERLRDLYLNVLFPVRFVVCTKLQKRTMGGLIRGTYNICRITTYTFWIEELTAAN